VTGSLFSHFNFPIGAAIKSDQLSVEAYRTLALKHYNSYSTELCFKASRVHPQPYDYYWAAADELVRFAQANNKRLHGHALVWNEDLPAWLTSFQGDDKAWTEVLRTHIEEIAGRYRNRIHSWDVANEAFSAEGKLHGYPWQQAIGDKYLADLFNFAHKADPDALLFYNDFDLELNEVKRRAVLEHLTTIRSAGCRVDGIGLQLHLQLTFEAFEELKKTFEEIVEYGFLVHISELDIAIDAPEDTGLLPPFLEQQATLVRKIFDLYSGIPQAHQYGITFWGISDADSWMNFTPGMEKRYPLLFDKNYIPKPALQKLLGAAD